MKKNFLKRTCLWMSMAILITSFAFSVSAKRFTDINYGRDFFDDINYVVDNGIMNGTSSTLFSPNEKITRAMLIAILYNKEGRPTPTASNPFSDVSSKDYYYNAVRWAYGNKIVSGTSGSTFNPDQKVTREDTAVFLYRYARHKGYDIDKTLSLSNVTDYSSIESYARTPVAWVMASRIMLGACDVNDNGTEASGKFEPKEQVARAECARIIVRFGKMAEGILMNKDAFSFSNGSSYFPESVSGGKYYLTTQDEDALLQRVRAIYGSASDVIGDVEDHIKLPWGGSCYGMAATTVLDKLGKIDLNGNYSSASTMYSMGSPKNNAALESAINYYQVIQAALPSDASKEIKLNSSGINTLLTSLDKNGLAMFNFVYEKYGYPTGHAIVIYDYVKNSDGSFTVKAYDNKKVNENITITIPATKDSITVNEDKWTKRIVEAAWIIDDFSFFDLFDIDGYYNDTTFTPISSFANYGNSLAAYTRLYVSAGDNFIITNAEGETIVYENGDFSGTMSLVKQDIIITGNDTPVEWILYVEPSACFSCETENESCDFSLLSTKAYTGLRSQGAHKVTIANDDEISFEGEKVQYKATLSLKSEGTIQMSGKGESAGFFGWQGDELAAKSESGEFEVLIQKDLQVLDKQTFVGLNNQIYIDINEEMLKKDTAADCMKIFTKNGSDKLPHASIK